MITDKRVAGRSNIFDKEDEITKTILNLAKKRKQVIYGARSIKAQAPLFARPTKDWDIFDKKPKQASTLLKNQLNKIMGINYFFNKPAKHEGTWKVKGKGADYKRNTEDDESIADYSIPTERFKIIKKNGLRYRELKKEIERKKATIKDPEFEFRKEKDSDDLRRIQTYIKVKHIVGGGIG